MLAEPKTLYDKSPKETHRDLRRPKEAQREPKTPKETQIDPNILMDGHMHLISTSYLFIKDSKLEQAK